jgi:hypothetical protein
MEDASAAADADQGSALPPHMAYAPNTEYKPVDETVADFSDDEFKTTNQRFGGDYFKVSHLNFFSNYLERIEGLGNYPNMMRLTLRENNLKTLDGIGESPYLRWIDVSNNYLEDFRGMGVMMVSLLSCFLLAAFLPSPPHPLTLSVYRTSSGSMPTTTTSTIWVVSTGHPTLRTSTCTRTT